MASRTRFFSAAAVALTVGSRIGDGLAQRRDGRVGSYRLATRVFSPCGHESAALLEGVATAICSLDCVRNRVCQRSLADLAREVGVLAAPIAERTAHSVHCCLVAEALQKLAHRALTQVAPPLAREKKLVPPTKSHLAQNGECSV